MSKGYCLLVTDKQRASITFSADEIEWQLHRLETVLSYCDKNNRELQTVNLMAQRNVPVTFVQESAPVSPSDSSAAPKEAPATDAKPKPALSRSGRIAIAKPVQRRFTEEFEITGKENATTGARQIEAV